MPDPIITLTTDFGTSDHFVGAMKGVILSIAPRASIIDITHDVQAFDVTEGAFAISQAYPYFPKKTIHVVIVDPGVGSARRPLLVEMAGQYFIAPDNGVLSMVYRREKHKVRHITAERYFRQPVSPTFHGRDIFSPVGAHLAAGIPPARFGKLIQDHVRLTLDQPTQTGKRTWTGAVLRVDRFGNLITSFHIEAFAGVATRPFEIAIGFEKLTRLAQTFSDGQPGELMIVIGSSGFLEVAANQASAAKLLGCAAGSPVELTLYS
ncbi:MAG: SAM-dependent chlorinase/fluorinase [Acidobacteriota bacterium]|nr:SAM-dependent chlorinase/fluorinase [Acidobacteriota bacterium]